MKKKPSIEWTTVIVAIIGLIGIIVTAVLSRESGERAASCPYSHLLGAIADGKQVIFYIDNEKIASFDLDGYPTYAGIHMLGTSPMVAGIDKVWLDFVK